MQRNATPHDGGYRGEKAHGYAIARRRRCRRGTQFSEAILTEVEMIGNDTQYFLGTCGKDGQSAAVTAGTPTLKLRNMTVGGRK